VAATLAKTSPQNNKSVMRWINHQLTAFGITFLVTGNTLYAIVATAGSVLPDWIEFQPLSPFRKHRGVSHSIFLWIAAYASISLIWVTFLENLLIVFTYVSFLFLGALLHLLTDAASMGGIPLLKQKQVALGLYKTYGASEYIVVVAVLLTCFIIRSPVEIVTSLNQTISKILTP